MPTVPGIIPRLKNAPLRVVTFKAPRKNVRGVSGGPGAVVPAPQTAASSRPRLPDT